MKLHDIKIYKDIPERFLRAVFMINDGPTKWDFQIQNDELFWHDPHNVRWEKMTNQDVQFWANRSPAFIPPKELEEIKQYFR